MLPSLRKSKKNMYQTNEIHNQGHLPTNFTPDIDYTHEPVVPYDDPVVNTFVGDCK